MIVSQFLSWAQTASAPSRADGVNALARAYLYSDLDRQQSRDAVRALTSFLDDPSPIVRRALADAFASAADAPHHIVLALAEDQPDIASIILSRSPILSDEELIDCAASAPSESQGAIAVRYTVSAALSAALAEVGSCEALIALARNRDAVLPDAAVMRMVQRHGADPDLRDALLARDHLPVQARADLVSSTAGALMVLVTERAWMTPERARRVTREATDRAAVAIAADVSSEAVEDLAVHLRDAGQVTVTLVLRALLSGNEALFKAVLSDLAEVSITRVEGLMRNHASSGFAALYRKAGLPRAYLPVFRFALAAFYDHDEARGTGAGLSLSLVSRVLAGCAAFEDEGYDRLMVVLRRFEAEAARDEARADRPMMTAAPLPEPVMASPPETAAAVAFDFDEAVPSDAFIPPEPEPRPMRFTIDFAALEAELLAA